MEDKKVKRIVREGYAKIAKEAGSCCVPSCCGTTAPAHEMSRKMGYSDEELKSVPEGANLGLGCGNPVALASLRRGETVLDLGSGVGFDCFLAANKVGKNGKVIGVDMTPEMIEKARENAEKGKYENVEFRLGEIENLPVANNSVDVVISNCVVNLVSDKKRVFQEAFRVLKAGGRMMVSDLVLVKELPEFIKDSVEAYIGCLSGAIMMDRYVEAVKTAGFQNIRIVDETFFPIELMINDPTAKAIMKNLRMTPETAKDIAKSVVSIKISATKPE